MAEDTSRISITAHYTGYVWYKHGLSTRDFATNTGCLAYYGLMPGDKAARYLFGNDLETLLLQRHLIIDHILDTAIREHGQIQVLELACGLSPRGHRFCCRYNEEQLKYVEADLPGMAARKRELLSSLKSLNTQHKVCDCNILEESGELSLDHLVLSEFDNTKPLYVITEGLVNYFPTPVIEPFWTRLHNVLSSFSVGVYLTDMVSNDQSNRNIRWLRMGMHFLSVAARGKTSLHYSGDKGVEAGFKALGFSEVQVHNPKDYYGQLSIPVSRASPTIRVVEIV